MRDLICNNAKRRAEGISQTIRDALVEFRSPTAPHNDLTFVIAKVL